MKPLSNIRQKKAIFSVKVSNKVYGTHVHNNVHDGIFISHLIKYKREHGVILVEKFRKIRFLLER